MLKSLLKKKDKKVKVDSILANYLIILGEETHVRDSNVSVCRVDFERIIPRLYHSSPNFEHEILLASRNCKLSSRAIANLIAIDAVESIKHYFKSKDINVKELVWCPFLPLKYITYIKQEDDSYYVVVSN